VVRVLTDKERGEWIGEARRRGELWSEKVEGLGFKEIWKEGCKPEWAWKNDVLVDDDWAEKSHEEQGKVAKVGKGGPERSQGAGRATKKAKGRAEDGDTVPDVVEVKETTRADFRTPVEKRQEEAASRRKGGRATWKRVEMSERDWDLVRWSWEQKFLTFEAHRKHSYRYWQ
jgi:hypothetical protein